MGNKLINNESYKFAGTSGWSVPISQSQTTVFVGQWMEWDSLPPCISIEIRKGEDRRKKKREVLHLFRCYTHTHTRPEPGQPWKARGRKKRTQTTGRRPEPSRGEGNKRTSKTNLHGETDLTKTAHTPKLHDALRRGTRGKLGTKWGTSWWQTRKPKQLIKQQDSVPNYLKVVRYSLSGTVVKSCPNWHKRLSSSSELGAQHVSPHQIPKRPHLQEKDMPVAFCL